MNDIKSDFNLLNTDSMRLLKQMDYDSIDFILTDPPYEVDAKSGGGYINNKAGTLPIKDRIGYISEGFDMNFYFHEFIRVLKKVNVAIFCSNKQVNKIMNWWEKEGYYPTLLVWWKYNAIPAVNNRYMNDIEFIVVVRETGSPFNNIGVKEQSRVFKYPFPSGDFRIHPTEKPIPLLRRLLRIHTNKNDLVLDPFAGSFTTALACYEENRKFIGAEIDKDMYEKAVKRFNNVTSQLKLFSF